MLKAPPLISSDLHISLLGLCWNVKMIKFWRYYIFGTFLNFFIGHRAFSSFFLILEIFQTYFLNILNYPLSDLSWKTEKCRPNNLRGGVFSIRLQKYQQLQFKTTFFCCKNRFISLACKVRPTKLFDSHCSIIRTDHSICVSHY